MYFVPVHVTLNSQFVAIFIYYVHTEIYLILKACNTNSRSNEVTCDFNLQHCIETFNKRAR